MKDNVTYAQLIARLALGVGFLLPVMDRIGWMGAPGSGNVAWGDWPHFLAYNHSLMPFLGKSLADILALLATTAEIIIGIGLILGFKTKWMATGAALITGTFAVFMIISLGIAAPFKYPVFVFTGAGLLLSNVYRFKWSIDDYITTK
ncbi:DoxX family membrane protein [Chitinophaga pendula]|uniref:DoxX family membrane protein n=1 Tax=Chitinophaga TaxID=79328 RepID=UPI000BB06CE8|nr:MULTISPECIES: DoxX family membrane protein [Chitinophaga]ASZ13025.1 DoxX family protein [Chitinophaga sp. MD30]UCJ09344.1 DoxX family membrane protein [Chitinophaga pendula]